MSTLPKGPTSKPYRSSVDEVAAFHQILAPNHPTWLDNYINTPEMLRLAGIGMNCGTDYSGCFNPRYWYSVLDHSIGCSLIVWNFTRDRTQTLAALFHDIATPAFKHCIDFMNGDPEIQESTEKGTDAFIRNSTYITALLERDGISQDEVIDYKTYPIADNASPRLAADRLEYTFSSGLSFSRVWDLDSIEKIYHHLTIARNEDGVNELAFDDVDSCEEFVSTASKLWQKWVSDDDRTAMQFIADLCLSAIRLNVLTKLDLYTLSEREFLRRIEHCGHPNLTRALSNFRTTTSSSRIPTKKSNVYCANITSKARFINPLVVRNGSAVRISSVSKSARETIDAYLDLPKGGYWTCLDFPPF